MTSTTTDRIDGLSTSVAIKAPVTAATTANITLSGTQTIDGIAVVADNRVLVKDQTTASENGIYLCKAGAWTRAKDCDGNRDLTQGTLVYVTSGTANGDIWYRCTNSGTITIGTTSLAFTAASISSAALTGTSTTSLTVGTGSQVFTTQSGRAWVTGLRLRAASDDGTKVMEGEITAYSSTSLTIDVDYTEGSGAHADWNIGFSGARGATGDTGATGATGPAGSGDVVGPASATANSLARFDGTTGKLLKDGAVIGIDVQYYDDNLTNLAALTPVAGQYIGYNTSGAEAVVRGIMSNTGYIANLYYSGQSLNANGTLVVTANRLYCTEFVCTERTTFTRIGIEVTASAGTSARLGIYNASSGVPGSLVVDAGTVSTASTGIKEATISTTLMPGPYFLGVVFDNTPTVVAGGTFLYLWGGYLGFEDIGAGAGYPGPAYVAHTFGALPNPFGTATRVADISANSIIPTIALRVV